MLKFPNLTPVLAVGNVYPIKGKYLLFKAVDTKLGLCFTDIETGDRVNLSFKDIAEPEPVPEPKQSEPKFKKSKKGVSTRLGT